MNSPFPQDGDHFAALRAAIDQLTTAELPPNVLVELEQNARPHLDRLMQRYIETQKLDFEYEEQLWLTVHSYLKEVIAAYSLQLQKPVADTSSALLSRVLLHALHHLGLMTKWHYLRYQPLPQGVWALMHYVYQQAESLQTRDGMVEIASHQRRYLQALMLDTLNLSNMLKSEIEMVDCWLRAWCQDIMLEQECDENRHLFFVDFQQDRSARRLRDGTAAPDCRYWQLDEVIVVIEQMQQQLAGQELPGMFDEHANIANAIRLINQLLTEWSRKDYRRQRRTEDREAVSKRARVSHGMLGICQHVKNMAFSADTPSAARYDTFASGWKIENESKFGLGAVVDGSLNSWLHPGCLIALDYELNPVMSLVGSVRSIKQQVSHELISHELYVGIDVFSHAPSYVRLQYLPNADSSVEADTSIPALYLGRDDDRELPPTLIMSLADYVEAGAYTLCIQEYERQVNLGSLIDQGVDWIRVAATITTKSD